MKYLDSSLNFIAPHHCYGCNEEGGVCCQKCLEEIADPGSGLVCYKCAKVSSSRTGICATCCPKQSLDSVFWYADYGNPLSSRLVKSLKFHDTFAAYEPMAEGVSRAISRQHSGRLEFTTAVPTANKRIRARGWDQAKLVARGSSRYGNPPYKSLLIRTSSFDQIGASKIERSAASKRFFKPIRKALIKNTTILLVDDVVTTGSTLDSAAKALKTAGAKEVHGVVFARQGLKTKKLTKIM